MEGRLEVDDFYTTTDFAIATDASGLGSYSTAWTATDYQLEPLNGIYDGQTGWPYFEIVGVGNYGFPLGFPRAAVRVTAKWGWDAVPSPIKEATLIGAEYLWKQKDAPFGVAGFGEYGAVRVREHPIVKQLIEPYRRYAVVIG